MKEIKIGDYLVRVGNEKSELVEKRYSEAGLALKERASSSNFVIECVKNGEVVGSVTFDFGDTKNFFCAANYKEKINELQNQGAKLAEITKLAVERGEDIRWVTGCMFNLLYRICVIREGITHLVIECKPNHVTGYKRLFKFETADGPTYNEIAKGDAYLLVMDIEKKTGLKIN